MSTPEKKMSTPASMELSLLPLRPHVTGSVSLGARHAAGGPDLHGTRGHVPRGGRGYAFFKHILGTVVILLFFIDM